MLGPFYFNRLGPNPKCRPKNLFFQKTDPEPFKALVRSFQKLRLLTYAISSTTIKSRVLAPLACDSAA